MNGASQPQKISETAVGHTQALQNNIGRHISSRHMPLYTPLDKPAANCMPANADAHIFYIV